MSRASNLAGFSTSISPPANLSVGVVTATGINVVGIITATSFVGDGINVVGIITASSFSGDGSNLTGISINRFLSIESRVGIVTVTAFAGILTVFGREEDTNVLV